MKCETPVKKVILYCIGYKYSKDTTMIFISTNNTGSTKAGLPYHAHFADEHGNRQSRDVFRPKVITDYFVNAGVIDGHNNARQGELDLEHKWVTHDCWFRLATTFIGFTVTDCWKAFKYHTGEKLTVREFADRIAKHLVQNAHSTSCERGNFIPWDVVTCPPVDTDLPATLLSPLTSRSSESNSTVSEMALSHEFSLTNQEEGIQNKRRARRICSFPSCSFKTSLECQNPVCLSKATKKNKNVTTGVFYCKQHLIEHHLALLGEQ